jgi:hypothetical protein
VLTSVIIGLVVTLVLALVIMAMSLVCVQKRCCSHPPFPTPPLSLATQDMGWEMSRKSLGPDIG